MTDERERTTNEREHGHERERVDTSHLDGVEDGCGCAEVWEHLSEDRDADADPEIGSGEGIERGATAGES